MAILAGLSLTATAPPPAAITGEVDLSFQGLRSSKGTLRACLTRVPKFFPHCDKDPAAYHQVVPAGPTAQIRFTDVVPGDYAIAVLHDENGNARIDMMLGIPKEGVGFSRNPAVVMSPPRFNAAQFRVATASVVQVVKMKYFL